MSPCSRMKSRGALFALLLLCSCHRASVPPSISIDDAWARATLPGQNSSAAYLTIRNLGGEDHLLSVSSGQAHASLHSTTMEGGVMRMRPIRSLDIPANSTETFAPGHNHIMLMGLKGPLGAGDTVPLDLKFDKSGDKHVTARVRATGGMAM